MLHQFETAVTVEKNIFVICLYSLFFPIRTISVFINRRKWHLYFTNSKRGVCTEDDVYYHLVWFYFYSLFKKAVCLYLIKTRILMM